jgi:sec-independent protein translocase protein TatB
MFGMGFSEIVVILVIALIFLGPEKLPDAAKSISNGIRGLRKQTRDLQSQIENDEHIGGAIRDLRSAMRGEEPRPPVRNKPLPPPPGIPIPGETPPGPALITPPVAGVDPPMSGEVSQTESPPAPAAADPEPAKITLPDVAGETDAEAASDQELASLVRPAEGTVAKGS